MTYTTRFGTVTFNSPTMGEIEIPDLTKFAEIPDLIKNNPIYQLQYVIRDGERLDQISRRIYGREDRLWIIMLMNDMWNLSDSWPLNDSELGSLIQIKYPFNSPSDIHHYEDVHGCIVDPFSGAIRDKVDTDLFISMNHLTPVSILDHETAVNDSKRNIKILDPALVDRLESAMDSAFDDPPQR